MGQAEIGNLPTHHGEVGLRFGIYARDGLLGAHQKTLRDDAMKKVLQQLHQKTVERRLGHLVIDETVEQFGVLRYQPGLSQNVVSFN